jgi:CDP-diacylglycerol---glycerol-3-phosphate 3-phosphatidyltransferase
MPYRRLKVVKGYLDTLLTPPLRFLRSRGVHPLHLTALSLPCGVLGVLVMYERPLLGAVLVFSYLALDVLDGTMARVTGTVSRLGDSLDFLIDRLVASSFLIVYYFHGGDPWFAAAGLTLIAAVSLEDAGLIKR